MTILRNRYAGPSHGAPERPKRTTRSAMTGRARAACCGTRITRTASVIQPCHDIHATTQHGTTHGAHMPRRVADASDPIRPEQQLHSPVPLSDRLAQCSHGSRAARKGWGECCRHIEPAREFRCIASALPVRCHALRPARALRRPYAGTAPSLRPPSGRAASIANLLRHAVRPAWPIRTPCSGSHERTEARIRTGSS